jgi:mannose-6-phosphate isomerase-like protein (cupin superfamily)
MTVCERASRRRQSFICASQECDTCICGGCQITKWRDEVRTWQKVNGCARNARHSDDKVSICYQVKRITANPCAKLSVQKHHHRAEHWIVVRGIAKVTRGEETIRLSENDSNYIPLDEIHALENPGKIPLEPIEVQSGSYLSEDDVVGLEDNYGWV